jgi:tRNA pseudouridine55 synthase
MGMFGFFAIRKPAGPTSHDVVAGVRRRLGRGVKVGHAGTLDPFADGVLVLCVGAATRLASYVQAQPKRYRATVLLGATSSTDDPEGEIAAVPGATVPDEPAVRSLLERFVGTIQQVPPAHSAVHVAGRRAYRLARAGKPPRLAPRAVTVHGVELLGYAYPRLEIDVRCGSGTYLRALARDIGAALGTGGYCQSLTRTAIGDFRIEDAVAPDDLDPSRHLLPPLRAVAHLPRVTVDASQLDRLGHGARLALPAALPPGEVAVLGPDGSLLAIGRVIGGGQFLRPERVFVEAPLPPGDGQA